MTYPDGDGRVIVLREVDVVAGPGVTAVVGPSGSGKSTLLRILAGLQPADHGTVRVAGESFDCRQPGDGRSPAVYIPQDFQLVPFLTVADNVELAAEVRGVTLADVRQPLALVGLDHLAERRPDQLSGGQQQRVALARALASDAPVLLADEPSGSLDADTSREISAVLGEVGRSGRTVIVATHDEAIIERADRVLHLHAGAIREAG